MSDCSTAAMLPKEQPKTCGTCGQADPYALSCDICCKCKSRRFQVGYDEAACSHWVYGPLEQRCQQLELVVWNMLEYIKGKYIPFMPCTDQYAIQEFTRMLKDLGVSLDD